MATSAGSERPSADVPKTFSESLMVASKVFSEAGSRRNDTATVAPRQRLSAENATEPKDLLQSRPVSLPTGRNLTTLPQQRLSTRPMPAAMPVLSSQQRPFEGNDEFAVTPRVDPNEVSNPSVGGVTPSKRSKVESTVADSGGVQSQGKQSIHAARTDSPLQDSSRWSTSTIQSSTSPTVHSAATLNLGSDALAPSALNDVQNGEPNGVQVSLPTSIEKVVSNGSPLTASDALSSETLKFGSDSALDQPWSVAPGTSGSISQSEIPGASLNKPSNGSLNSRLNSEQASPSAPASDLRASLNLPTRGDVVATSSPVTADAAAATAVATDPSGSGTTFIVPADSLDSLGTHIETNGDSLITGESPRPVLNSKQASGSAPAPGSRASLDLSTKGDVVSTSAPVTGDSAAGPAVATSESDMGNGLTVPFEAAELLVTQFHAIGDSPVASLDGLSGQISASASRSSLTTSKTDPDGNRESANKATGVKQGPSASEQASGQSSSQGATPSGDASQDSNSFQGQSAAVAQMNLTNHAVASSVHAQSAVIASPVQGSSTSVADAGRNARPMENSLPAVAVPPPAAPVINTAKLIQDMGQSEMRVGMRSNEFGNISISTSSTRELISAQISLEHGELARTLAAHLPEVQQRLGVNQAVDLRIDLNGQGISTSSGMSNGSAEGSQGGRRQARGEASSYSASGVAEQPHSRSEIAIATGVGRLDTRLDIRV